MTRLAQEIRRRIPKLPNTGCPADVLNTGGATANLRKYGFGVYCEIPDGNHHSGFLIVYGLAYFCQVFRACDT